MSTYQENTLKNGLKLITSTNENTSIATVSLWVKTGSRHEKKDQLGYTHFLEHLLCKKISNLYNENTRKQIGAYTNAFTSRESTRFIIEVPTKYINDSIKVLSSVISDFEINTEDFEINKKIIIEEALADENKPIKKFNHLTLKKFFDKHPLSQDPIGSMDIIKSSTVEQLREYQHNHFIPENSAVIVISNLQHEQVLKEIEKYFGLWSNNQMKEKEIPVLVPANNENYFYVPTQTEQTKIILNFHSPGGLNLQEEASLIVIGNHLGFGVKSFLSEKLRHETGLVYTVSTSNTRYTDAGIFQIQTASSDPIKTVKIIFDSINNFLQNTSPQEIEETKERIHNISERFYTDRKNELGFLGEGFILFSKLFEPENYKKLIDGVTFEDVINSTKKYLNKNNSLLAIMGPTNIKENLN
ncbi:MAG: pitrilysin family protein [bacterium]|nr:pitrilysin family protein [bacterium]